MAVLYRCLAGDLDTGQYLHALHGSVLLQGNLLAVHLDSLGGTHIVVGNGDDLHTELCGMVDQLFWGISAVGSHRVAVQIHGKIRLQLCHGHLTS